MRKKSGSDANQDEAFRHAKNLSPRRSTTKASNIDELVQEQLAHFSIVPTSEMGKVLADITELIYRANQDIDRLWQVSLNELTKLDRHDRIAYFNAKKFLSFQLAKLLDGLQQPFRHTYQSLTGEQSVRLAKGPYPIFDNVTAIFSATPVITRTATYIYACTEWIDQAFQGKEMLLEVYSRLLNPTSVALANHMVDLECGPYAMEYMAWNFNSGMAAIDTVLAHLLGHRDIVIASRNVYGGTFQLLEDWYGKVSNLDVAVYWFDGYDVESFNKALAAVRDTHQDRLQDGREIFLFIESPCNPHGYVLDVPAICKSAHEQNIRVILDSTVATPFLSQPLLRDDVDERPDFVVHSYTKDITGTGVATAGVVIGRNEDMFIPKHESVRLFARDGTIRERSWRDTLFWNVYYVKGAFLDADKAFEVINGSRTLELRMLRKCINTEILARVLDSHPAIDVNCNALEHNFNHDLAKQLLKFGLTAPLFTINFEKASIERDVFTRFFDCLEPAFGHMVSLGQSNTVILCPALTSHSEMGVEALKRAGISPTTIRISVGDEDVRSLIAHFIEACKLAIDPAVTIFSTQFMKPDEIDQLTRSVYLATHERWIDAQPSVEELMK